MGYGSAMLHPEFAYKVAPRGLVDAARAKGRFIGAPIDLSDGFIHLSTAEQLAETLRRYFAGQPDLVLFSVCMADFGPAMVLGAVARWRAVSPSLRRAADERGATERSHRSRP